MSGTVPPGSSGYELTLRRVLIWVALYSIPAIAVVRPVTDVDIWYYLRTGQWIVEQGTVPTTDPFSVYGQGKPFVAYQWLFEVIAHGLYTRLGLTGVLLFRVVLVFAFAGLVHSLVARNEPRFFPATVLTAL